MDFLTLVEILGGLVGGAISVYLVAIQGVKAAINKEAKGIAFDQALKQIGLGRTKLKDWNDLDPKGVANLVTVLKAVQSSSGAGLAGGYSASIQKSMQELQTYAQMAAGLAAGTGTGVGASGNLQAQQG